MIFAFFGLVQVFCFLAYLWILKSDSNSTNRDFVRREKVARRKREKSLFEKIRRDGAVYEQAGVTSSFVSEEHEGAHALEGLGSPLTKAQDDKLFGKWPEFDPDASAYTEPSALPRESRYPDGHAVRHVGSLSGGRSSVARSSTTALNPLIERI